MTATKHQLTPNMNNQTTSKLQASHAHVLNKVPAITATIFSDVEDYFDDEGNYHVYHYGLRDVLLWNPLTQRNEPLSNDPDKFRTTSAISKEIARTEFWKRFNAYLIKRFGFRLHIEFRNV